MYTYIDLEAIAGTHVPYRSLVCDLHSTSRRQLPRFDCSGFLCLGNFSGSVPRWHAVKLRYSRYNNRVSTGALFGLRFAHPQPVPVVGERQSRQFPTCTTVDLKLACVSVGSAGKSIAPCLGPADREHIMGYCRVVQSEFRGGTVHSFETEGKTAIQILTSSLWHSPLVLLHHLVRFVLLHHLIRATSSPHSRKHTHTAAISSSILEYKPAARV